MGQDDRGEIITPEIYNGMENGFVELIKVLRKQQQGAIEWEERILELCDRYPGLLSDEEKKMRAGLIGQSEVIIRYLESLQKNMADA